MSNFMKDMQQNIDDGKPLTRRQAEAYERCKQRSSPNYRYDGPIRLSNSEFNEKFLSSIKDIPLDRLTAKQRAIYNRITVR